MEDTRCNRQKIEYKISAVIPVYNREKQSEDLLILS